MKKTFKKPLSLICALVLLFSIPGCAPNTFKPPERYIPPSETTEAPLLPEASQASSKASDEIIPGLKDDFYQAVNQEQLALMEIPASEAYTDNFFLLHDQNTKRLRELILAASEDSSSMPGSDFYNIGAAYLTGMDQQARNAGGYGQAEKFLSSVDNASTVSELLDTIMSFSQAYGFYSLFGITLKADSIDSNAMVYYLLPTDTGLSKEEWFSDTGAAKEQVQYFLDYLTDLWMLNGLSQEEAVEVAGSVSSAMKDIAQASLSLAEQYDADKTYHACQMSDLEVLFGGVLPMERLYEIYEGNPEEKLVISDMGLLDKMVSYLTQENLPLLKNYVKTCFFCDLADYSSMDAYRLSKEYSAKKLGLEELKPFDEDLPNMVQELLGFECGRLYSENYFSEESRKDLEAMVADVVSVYEKRIPKLSWMKEETKKEALEKLAAIDAYIGYPDVWPQDQYELSLKRPEEGGLFIDNVLEIYSIRQEHIFASKDKPTDKAEWLEPPQTVNAYYYPLNNGITLMAGILQEPFYSPGASPEENLGRIGFVIAHEITHAFDTNGSQYDASGNLRNWWEEEDWKNFQALSQQVIDYYDGIEINGIPVNGEQTLVENIADLGALSCITEIAKEKGYDLRKVYIAYGKLWVSKIRDEYAAYLINTDTHAPDQLRVNRVLSAIDKFYEVFDIKEGDGMYVEPKDRPKIW